MINAIFKGIFWLITKFFNILVSPFVLLITALFPSVANYFSRISTYLYYCTTYVRSILSLLLIDDSMITALFDYFAIIYSIWTIMLAIKFALNIYNKFKP